MFMIIIFNDGSRREIKGVTRYLLGDIFLEVSRNYEGYSEIYYFKIDSILRFIIEND